MRQIIRVAFLEFSIFGMVQVSLLTLWVRSKSLLIFALGPDENWHVAVKMHYITSFSFNNTTSKMRSNLQ